MSFRLPVRCIQATRPMTRVRIDRAARAARGPGRAPREPAPDRAPFRPYRSRLSGVLALIVFSSALGRSRRSCSSDILDDALPENDLRLLSWLVAGMIAIAVVTGALGVVQTLALEPGRPARDARPAHGGLPAPAAAVARVLHADANRRGAVADRERHRRRARAWSRRRRRRSSSNVDDRDRDRRRDVHPRLAARALRARAAAGLRLAHPAGRRAAARRSRPCGRSRWRTSRASSRSRSRSRGSCSARRWAARPSWRTASSRSRSGWPGSRCGAGWRAAG